MTFTNGPPCQPATSFCLDMGTPVSTSQIDAHYPTQGRLYHGLTIDTRKLRPKGVRPFLVYLLRESIYSPFAAAPSHLHERTLPCQTSNVLTDSWERFSTKVQ